MTSKQRAALKAKANGCEAVFQIGKDGVSDTLAAAVSDALDARELVKLSVLKTCAETPGQVLQTLADRLNAEPVCAIGNKIVLYRFSPNKTEHIEL